MSKLEVTLTKQMEVLLDQMVATGAYSDREDAVRAILRDLAKTAKTVKKVKQGTGGDTGGTVVIQYRVPDEP